MLPELMQAAVGSVHSALTQPSTVSGATHSPPDPLSPCEESWLVHALSWQRFAPLHNHCGQGNNTTGSIFHQSDGASLNYVQRPVTGAGSDTALLPDGVCGNGLPLSTCFGAHCGHAFLCCFLFSRQAANEQHPNFCHRTL